jgi:type IV secretory pathway VirB10-like protein
MSNLTPTSAAPDGDLEHHNINDTARQPLEVKASGKSKMVVLCIVGFILFLALVFIMVGFAKGKMKDFSNSRIEKQEEKKAKNAETPSNRKAISFAEMFGAKPASAVAATTPENAPNTTATPIKLNNPDNNLKGSNAQQAIEVKLPSMMLDSDDVKMNASKSAANNVQQTQNPMSQESLLLMLNSAQNGSTNPTAQQPTQSATGTLPQAKNIQEVADRSKTKNLTNTKQVLAANLGNADYVITRGHHFPCVLETQLVSNLPGTTSCIFTENIFSTNGKTLLLEKGTRAVGEYASGLKVGDTRLAILWNRVETPSGIVLDIDSPSADQVGASGVPGWIDNHWMERIGGAFLLSFVQDYIKYKTEQNNPPVSVGNSGQQYTNSTSTGSDMAKKVLDTTINIAPTLVKNRGELIMVEVRHDLWFQEVYKVK